jgi:phenylpyruvate tautomerase
MMVIIRDELPMLFGGNDEPVATDPARPGTQGWIHPKLAAELTAIMHTELGIESQRVYIVFMDADLRKWAWDGRTFA